MTTTTRARRRALDAHPTDAVEQHVVLATDGGLAGLSTLRWLADRGQHHVLDIDVITVLDPEVLGMLDGDEIDDDTEYSATARSTVRQAKEYLGRVAPSAETRTQVLAGSPQRVLETAAHDADLLVVGTNRTGRRSPHFTAGFATELAQAASCPTVVVPRDWKPSAGPVVVGVEGDGSDDAALEFAAHEAVVLHRDLVLVHAWRMAAIVAPLLALDLDQRTVEEDAGARLSDAADRIRVAHPGLRIAPVLSRSTPVNALVRAGGGASMLVVGTHGLTAIDRILLSSVGRAVLDRPTCPVAVVPNDERA